MVVKATVLKVKIMNFLFSLYLISNIMIKGNMAPIKRNKKFYLKYMKMVIHLK